MQGIILDSLQAKYNQLAKLGAVLDDIEANQRRTINKKDRETKEKEKNKKKNEKKDKKKDKNKDKNKKTESHSQ